jgi:hypothetical protein
MNIKGIGSHLIAICNATAQQDGCGLVVAEIERFGVDGHPYPSLFDRLQVDKHPI